MPPQTTGGGGGPLTNEQIVAYAEVILRERGQFNEASGRCTRCGDTPASHVNRQTKLFQGCGAARKSDPSGLPWVAEKVYNMELPDFPRKAIRSAQERIAFSVVKSLHQSGKAITSNAVSDANSTWSVRDAYRLLQSLKHRGVLSSVDIAGEEEESMGGATGEAAEEIPPTQSTALTPAKPTGANPLLNNKK